MANQDNTVSKVPLDVDINCDPIGENVWGFKRDGDNSVAEQQLVANTGYHFEGGLATVRQIQKTEGNNPAYSYVTEGGNLIELISTGNDPTSGAPMNGVYLDGKFLDNVPAHGVESVAAVPGGYDDFCLTDGNPIAMKVLTNAASQTVAGTGGSSWSAISPTPAPNSGWGSVAYGNGIWIAIAQNATASQALMRSSDGGSTWTLITTPIAGGGGAGWTSAAYGNGIWLVMSSSASTTQAMIKSTDNGLTWSYVSGTPALVGSCLSIAYANGSWIGVCNTFSTTQAVIRSTDNGNTWAFVSGTPAPIGVQWRKVVFGNGVWVAMTGGTSASGSFMRSTDNGATWSAVTGTPVPAGSWSSLTYGGGVFVAVAQTTSTTQAVAKSTDNGATWSAVTGTPAPSVGWGSITYGNGVFVATDLSASTTQAVMRSIDSGATWSIVAGTPAPLVGWVSVYYGSGAFIAVAYTTSTTQAVMRSLVTTSSSFSVRLDEILSTGAIGTTRTISITGGGFQKPIALVKQSLGTSFTINSTQYFLAANAATTFNIFNDAGTAQIGGGFIPATWAAGSPKNLWAAKMSATEYWVVSLGTKGSSVPSGTITTAGTWTPYQYSWAVMQSRNGKHRIFLTGDNNTATNAQYMAFSGYKDFSAYTLAPATNAVDANADYSQVPISSYGYLDTVRATSFTHYYSGYLSPTTANYASGVTPFTSTANSNGPIQGFGRLSFVDAADYGSNPPFEFRLGMFKPVGSTFAAEPSFISVGNCYGAGGQVAIGTPLSAVGEFDPSWGPQIGANWDQVAWRWKGVYYVAKISQTPIRPIQKITTNLYKINSISPINVVSVNTQQLMLGSNDYNASNLITSTSLATPGTLYGALQIQWMSNQNTAANSIDVGGFTYTNGVAGVVTVAPIGAQQPAMHQSLNYFTTLLYTSSSSVASATFSTAWRGDGQQITGSTLNATFANQIVPVSNTYIPNTSLVPVPLGVRFAGYTIGTNSSATSSAFQETYVTSGYQGVVLTSEWDGYILGNQLQTNSVSFALFNQPYLFDGKNIYRLAITNGGVSVPLTVLCRADGLVYMTTSPQMAFFYDSFDNSVWAFDGGYTLKKIKRLDGFGAIQNGNYSVYESALTINTARDMVLLRDGFWSSVPKSTSMVPDGTEATMRMYDTVNGTQFGNTFNWWYYQYFGKSTAGTTVSNGITTTSSVVPFVFQSGYIGPDNNERMQLDAVTWAVYNENKSLVTLKVTVFGYDQDKFSTSGPKTFTINPGDYINGGIWRGRIQTQTQKFLGASFRIECNQDIRLYDLQYHWKTDAQATISGGRSQ